MDWNTDMYLYKNVKLFVNALKFSNQIRFERKPSNIHFILNVFHLKARELNSMTLIRLKTIHKLQMNIPAA